MTMTSLDIRPFEGTTPIKFGMKRPDVRYILGHPDSYNERVDSWGRRHEVHIGYDVDDCVYEIGLAPGSYRLTFNGRTIWGPDHHPDPNPTFLALDQEPLDCLGFLVFPGLGVATTGYHDDDPNQLAISVYQKGAWDGSLLKAKKPVLDKYNPHKSG